MATTQQRIIAASGAIMFFISTIALTVVVIFTMIQENKNSGEDTAAATDQTACEFTGQTETLSAPEGFRPDGDVTELSTTTLQEGTGQGAQQGDCLVVKYYGTLATNGELFDETYTTPSAIALELGAGRVIPGWEQGLEGIKQGEVRRLVIPSDLAYGEQSPSEKIPANSDLVFEVKLVENKK